MFFLKLRFVLVDIVDSFITEYFYNLQVVSFWFWGENNKYINH